MPSFGKFTKERISDSQILLLNPNCVLSLLMPYIRTKTNLPPNRQFDLCTTQGEFVGLPNLSPNASGLAGLEPRQTYYIATYNVDDDGVIHDARPYLLPENGQAYKAIKDAIAKHKEGHKLGIHNYLKGRVPTEFGRTVLKFREGAYKQKEQGPSVVEKMFMNSTFSNSGLKDFVPENYTVDATGRNQLFGLREKGKSSLGARSKSLPKHQRYAAAKSIPSKHRPVPSATMRPGAPSSSKQTKVTTSLTKSRTVSTSKLSAVRPSSKHPSNIISTTEPSVPSASSFTDTTAEGKLDRKVKSLPSLTYDSEEDKKIKLSGIKSVNSKDILFDQKQIGENGARKSAEYKVRFKDGSQKTAYEKDKIYLGKETEQKGNLIHWGGPPDSNLWLSTGETLTKNEDKASKWFISSQTPDRSTKSTQTHSVMTGRTRHNLQPDLPETTKSGMKKERKRKDSKDSCEVIKLEDLPKEIKPFDKTTRANVCKEDDSEHIL